MSCFILGKATKVPWRVKGQDCHIINATKPGEWISIDQLKYSAPGLIA
jgi:hypothetical protein